MIGMKRGVRGITHAFLTAALSFPAISTANADELAYALEIPAQDLDGALKTLAVETDQQVLFAASDVKGHMSPAINGEYSTAQAMELLLADTDLVYEITQSDVFLVQSNEVGTATDQRGASDSKNLNNPMPVLMAQNQTSRGPKQIDSESKGNGNEQNQLMSGLERPLDEIIVTGTRIRGIAPDSSPVRTYTREDIRISGAATAQDFMETVTANFGGGSNSRALGLPNDANSSFNASNNGGSFGSSVNLRGLGSGSTLVLLNGQRLAPSSGIGDFTDVSMIPASALDRVEVLTDGASSIYGGDAVAGVVNFITRNDFDDVEVSLRYGAVTDGDLDEYRGSIAGGKNWNSGNVIVAYEYFEQGSLSAGDREFSQFANLPNDLLPYQERHSILASISQEIGTDVRVLSSLAYSGKDIERRRTQTNGDIVNFFASTDSLSVSAGALWNVSEAWDLDVSGSYSDLSNDTSRVTLLGGSPPPEMGSDRRVDSTIWTVDITTSGTLLELPGGDLKVAFGGQYRDEAFANFRIRTDLLEREGERDVYALFGELLIPIVGSENSVSGIDRLELSVSGRYDDYSDFGSTSNPKIGVLWSPSEGFNLRSSYSTSFRPPPLGRVGASDFVAATALQSFWNSVLGLTPADPSIEDVVVITAFGTADGLDAENSRAFTAGFDFSRQSGNHEFNFTTTYFDIDFEDRLGRTPIPENRRVQDAPNIAFNNPELFPEGTIIFSPSESEIRELLDSLDSNNVFPGLDPLDAQILNLAGVVRNLSRTKVSGLDLDVSYQFDTDVGAVVLGLDGTYYIDYKQQAAVTTPLVERTNTLYNPVDLKLRGHVGYRSDKFRASLFLNHVRSYQTDDTDDASPIDSWSTIDMTLSYETGEGPNSSALKDLSILLTVRNLLNETPPSTPSIPPFGIFGFDPANASPLQRFASIELKKLF